jgi:hypothetical protein
MSKATINSRLSGDRAERLAEHGQRVELGRLKCCDDDSAISESACSGPVRSAPPLNTELRRRSAAPK